MTKRKQEPKKSTRRGKYIRDWDKLTQIISLKLTETQRAYFQQVAEKKEVTFSIAIRSVLESYMEENKENITVKPAHNPNQLTIEDSM